MIPPFLSPDIRPSLSSSAPLTGERHSAFIIHLYFHFFKQFNRYSEKERCKKRAGVCACPEKIASSRNLGGKSSLGARLRTRKVRGRDASLPAPLLASSLGLVGRRTVGALPQTPQGTLSLDPARGNFPLDPFSRLSWSRFHAPSACSFLVLRLSPCFPPTFREEPENLRPTRRRVVRCRLYPISLPPFPSRCDPSRT